MDSRNVIHLFKKREKKESHSQAGSYGTSWTRYKNAHTTPKQALYTCTCTSMHNYSYLSNAHTCICRHILLQTNEILVRWSSHKYVVCLCKYRTWDMHTVYSRDNRPKQEWHYKKEKKVLSSIYWHTMSCRNLTTPTRNKLVWECTCMQTLCTRISQGIHVLWLPYSWYDA